MSCAFVSHRASLWAKADIVIVGLADPAIGNTAEDMQYKFSTAWNRQWTLTTLSSVVPIGRAPAWWLAPQSSTRASKATDPSISCARVAKRVRNRSMSSQVSREMRQLTSARGSTLMRFSRSGNCSKFTSRSHSFQSPAELVGLRNRVWFPIASASSSASGKAKASNRFCVDLNRITCSTRSQFRSRINLPTMPLGWSMKPTYCWGGCGVHAESKRDATAADSIPPQAMTMSRASRRTSPLGVSKLRRTSFSRLAVAAVNRAEDRIPKRPASRSPCHSLSRRGGGVCS